MNKELAFNELLDVIHIKESKDSISYLKQNSCYFKYIKNNDQLHVNSKVWRVLENNYGMSSDNIKSFIKEKIENKFKLKNIIPHKILVKTWEEVCEVLNIDPIQSLPFVVAKTKLEKHLNASFKINKISEILNEGTIFDFTNLKQKKYYIWFQKTASGWAVHYVYSNYCAYSYVGFGFIFKDEETAKYIANTFLEIFIDYLPE